MTDGAELRVSTPSAEGVDAVGVGRFLDAVERAGIELHGLLVLRHGRVVAQGWWHPYSPDRPQLLYSLSKSFTSTALGLAVAEGLVDLDATVLSYFPELDADITDPRSRAMRVRHVAAMASGHRAETLFAAMDRDPADLVRGFLLLPPEDEPGSLFRYNQPCTYAVATIVQRQSGQSLVDYLRPRLLEPLGIGPVSWMEEPPSRNLGFSGLHATTDAAARLGQLYLQRGRWGDRQLLDPAWVEQATRRQVATPDEPAVDWRQGYGFQFWVSRHGYRGDGAWGQFCLVLPEQDMVVATTAATPDMQGLLDAVWSELLPAVDRPGLSAEADDRLADRLAAATLPVVARAAEPEDPAAWDGVTFDAHPQGAATPGDPWPTPTITSARLAQHDDGWRLALSDVGGTLTVPVGDGGWTLDAHDGVPVAVSGGWVGPDTFAADLVFVDTPHRVRVTGTLPDRTLTSVWPTTSLHTGTMLELRAP